MKLTKREEGRRARTISVHMALQHSSLEDTEVNLFLLAGKKNQTKTEELQFIKWDLKGFGKKHHYDWANLRDCFRPRSSVGNWKNLPEVVFPLILAHLLLR